MLGPAVMATSFESSKFKSAFGKLEPVAVKRLHPKAQRRGETRKLVSFFDSQRIDRSQLYNTNGEQSAMVISPEDQMIDISDHDARLVQTGNHEDLLQLGNHQQIELSQEQQQPIY